MPANTIGRTVTRRDWNLKTGVYGPTPRQKGSYNPGQSYIKNDLLLGTVIVV
jgi:hypothetical protein